MQNPVDNEYAGSTSSASIKTAVRESSTLGVVGRAALPTRAKTTPAAGVVRGEGAPEEGDLNVPVHRERRAAEALSQVWVAQVDLKCQAR
jgi:hypothetical protein